MLGRERDRSSHRASLSPCRGFSVKVFPPLPDRARTRSALNSLTRHTLNSRPTMSNSRFSTCSIARPLAAAFSETAAWRRSFAGAATACKHERPPRPRRRPAPPASGQTGGTMGPHDTSAGAAAASAGAKSMDAMHEKGIKAFPAKTAGIGNQLHAAARSTKASRSSSSPRRRSSGRRSPATWSRRGRTTTRCRDRRFACT